jgi:hypothetical protein
MISNFKRMEGAQFHIHSPVSINVKPQDYPFHPQAPPAPHLLHIWCFKDSCTVLVFS